MEYIKILDSNDLIKLDEYLSSYEVNEQVNGESLIYWAVFNNKLPVIKRLLELGADPVQRDSLDRSLLEIASYFGFHDVCKTLLENGAKIDEDCFRRAENGWDGFRQSEIIELLHEWQKGN
ncbi:ankyrin repeat domain-containing protein [Niallia sp. HCP3S3_B10]|uniref:ankyrin repeat domain-containing protein n=1 Tax=Niallia sp. HCP3S3_B10 TaxID=3438944 RepID=UPI003F8AC08E